MVDSDHARLRKGWLSTRLAPRHVIEAERSEQDSSRLRARVSGEHAEAPTRPSATDEATTATPRARTTPPAGTSRRGQTNNPPGPVTGPSARSRPPQPDPKPASARSEPNPPTADAPSASGVRPEHREPVAGDWELDEVEHGEAEHDDAGEDDAEHDGPNVADYEEDEYETGNHGAGEFDSAASVRAAPSVTQRRRQAAQRAARRVAAGAGASAPAVFGDTMSVVQAEFRPARDLVVIHQPESTRARAYRRLHSQLMARMRDQPETPAVAVVSPNAGEGRSSLCGNLAVLFARAGVQVLLIDADLRTGGQERLFGCTAETGLSDWLRGEHALTGLWFEDLPGLVLVPAGRYDTGAAERLSHPGFRQWIARQGKAEQVVIIDTAAGAVAEETQAVCAAAGGAVLVCRRNRTPLAGVRAFIDALESQRVQFYGAALLD